MAILDLFDKGFHKLFFSNYFNFKRIIKIVFKGYPFPIISLPSFHIIYNKNNKMPKENERDQGVGGSVLPTPKEMRATIKKGYLRCKVDKQILII